MTEQLDLFAKSSIQSLIQGDCLEVMRTMESNSIDFIVTDPPYGLNFMNKNWDDKTPSFEIWQEALRICKPGAMLAAFGGSRTHHHLMHAIEWAKWEIRDVIMWLYGSGFPKSHNKFGLKGYGTALKPAYEPIILAMKPLEGTFAQNAEKWGIAGINIDDCRIGTEKHWVHPNSYLGSTGEFVMKGGEKGYVKRESFEVSGRWPANIILDEEVGEMLDEQTGVLKSGNLKKSDDLAKGGIYEHGIKLRSINDFESNSGGTSRFFYCAKASSAERNKGLEGMPIKEKKTLNEFANPSLGRIASKSGAAMSNFHPTVKPIALMKYIIKLLAPPGNPTLLDPFAGSGSTLLAAKELEINALGIEISEEYCEIAKRRIA